jgi:hypothetical protein
MSASDWKDLCVPACWGARLSPRLCNRRDVVNEMLVGWLLLLLFH